MTISELIKALEDAVGPSRDLDADILEATGGCAHRETEYYCIEDGNDSDSGFTCKRCGIDIYGQRVPAFTASVDAAIALCERILPGSKWEITTTGFKPGCTIVIGEKFAGGAYAASPAIAACIAILRAKLSESDHG